jgi:hypothetical protein
MEQTIDNDESLQSYEDEFFALQSSPEVTKSDSTAITNYVKTRIFSLVALGIIVSGCGYLGQQVYFVAVDSFVAPAILSPDNDLVLDQKIKMEQILLEKGRAEESFAECNSDIEAGKKAIDKLNGLKDFASKALTWTKTTTGAQVMMGSADMATIATQKSQLNEMLERQELLVGDSKKNLDAGLVQKSDYDRELQTMNQLQIALFENERTKMQSELLFNQASMGQQALRTSGGSMPMPEQVMSMNQLITIECQLLQTEADMRAKFDEKQKDQEELSKISQLQNELEARPIFKAMDKQQDIAFAPYSSLKGITPGALLMDCVWGLFACKEVGKVINIIPGETILPDIFGSGQTRGQFIALDLRKDKHDESMQNKVLRVRNE